MQSLDDRIAAARSSPLELARQAVIFASAGALIVGAVILVWQSITVLLLTFLALLIAILFQGLAQAVSGWTRLPYWVSVALVLLLSVGLLALAAYLRAPVVSEQVGQLREELPEALERLRDMVAQYAWGRELLADIPTLEGMAPGGNSAMSGARTVFSKTFSVLGYTIFVFFTFLFIAFQPRLYRRGLEVLAPPAHREKTTAVLDDIWCTLWWWLVARIVAMFLVGVLVSAGLWALDIPFALSLGLLAALLDFVPNFGPIIAAIPALLLAVVQSPEKALYVALLYWGVQIIEGYIVTPIAQKKAIDMPPALVVISQFVLGAALGPIGLVLATPLAAVAIVLVQDLYLKPRDQSAS